jgi:hypothetical protein
MENFGHGSCSESRTIPVHASSPLEIIDRKARVGPDRGSDHRASSTAKMGRNWWMGYVKVILTVSEFYVYKIVATQSCVLHRVPSRLECHALLHRVRLRFGDASEW